MRIAAGCGSATREWVNEWGRDGTGIFNRLNDFFSYKGLVVLTTHRKPSEKRRVKSRLSSFISYSYIAHFHHFFTSSPGDILG